MAPMTKDGSTSQSNAATAVLQCQAKMTEISKFHPYNVLWAQLGDLYGSIGHPSKLSKTIVCGTQSTTVRKVLNILTYFIRCGEIKRLNSTKIIECDVIDDVINGTAAKPSTQCAISTNAENNAKPKGLSRTKTFVKDLTAVDDSVDYATTPTKNDIPNVLAFRDSRFVQQELRIGNFQMDTGIDMNPEQKLNIQDYKIKDASVANAKIKLLITSPENDRYECEAAAEAIDYVLKKIDDDDPLTLGELMLTDSFDRGNNFESNGPTEMLWNIEPVKEGIRVEQWPRFAQINTNIPKTDADGNGYTELKRSKSLNNKTNSTKRRITYQSTVEAVAASRPPIARYSSLSNLITANSVGACDRLQLGIEPVKEIICHEEEIYFEVAQKRIESEHNLRPPPISKSNSSSVVFVLGENEVLSGLKSSSPSPVPPQMENEVNPVASNIQEIPTKPVDSASNEDITKAIEGSASTSTIAASLASESTTSTTTTSAPTDVAGTTSTPDDLTGAINAPSEVAGGINASDALTGDTNAPNEDVGATKADSAPSEAAGATRAPDALTGATNATGASDNSTGATSTAIATGSGSGTGSTDSTKKKTKKHCTHKKHSGVKFNFEQYPQIVANYMKNKNLDISSYDFLEKGLKLEQENEFNFGATSTAQMLPMIPMKAPEDIEEEEEEEEQCECCAVFRVLQTPSNATELEFNNEDNIYPVPCVKAKPVSTIPQVPAAATKLKNESKKEQEIEKPVPKIEKNTIDLIRFPIPKTTMNNDKNRKMQPKIWPGFVPSLFIGITDHYIADMVLQVRFNRSDPFSNSKLSSVFPFHFFASGNDCHAFHVGTNFKEKFSAGLTLCSI